MTTADNVCLAKNGNNYYCEYCDYSTSKKYNIDIHCESKKHKNNITTTGDNELMAKNIDQKKYSCKNCEKIFNDRAGLWRHNKKCNSQQNIVCDVTDINNSKSEESLCEKIEIYDLVKYLMKENNELKSMMMEQNNKMIEQQNIVLEIAKNVTHNTTHTNAIHTLLLVLAHTLSSDFLPSASAEIFTSTPVTDVTMSVFLCDSRSNSASSVLCSVNDSNTARRRVRLPSTRAVSSTTSSFS